MPILFFSTRGRLFIKSKKGQDQEYSPAVHRSEYRAVQIRFTVNTYLLIPSAEVTLEPFEGVSVQAIYLKFLEQQFMVYNVESFAQIGHNNTSKEAFIHLATLTMSRSLVSNPITMSDFFSKPGTLLWTRTLGKIIPYFRKPIKASREQELHGHARKLRVTLLSIAYDNKLRYHFTDEGLSISRNVCYQLSRVSGKPFP